MGEVISSTIVQAVVERPVSLAYDEIKSALLDFKSDVEFLKHTRTTIEAVLLDAASVVGLSRAQQDALDKLSCLLDSLVDFLDARETRAMRKQVMGRRRFIVLETALFFSASNQLVARFIDARKVQDFRTKLDSISRDLIQFGNIVSLPCASQPHAWRVQAATSYITTDLVVGRVEDRNNIITMLSDNSVPSETTLSVTSIIGIGGLGKTTLARYVYNDTRVKSSYDVRFWVDITQNNFDVKEVLEKILSYTSDGELLNCEINEPVHPIIRAIGGKKFLLVLDNIWDQENLRGKWVDLKGLLNHGASGSKVLITTRSYAAAGIMDSDEPYMLGELTESDSWRLFEHIAFTPWQEQGVKAIGEEIAKRCPNVPLVIRSVAGILAGKCTVQEWQAFRDYQVLSYSFYGRDVMQTLRLSYDQLDAKLKLCLMYCSLFHKGFPFQKDELIHLWIALGYVTPNYKNQSLEEAGEEYLINLVNCGFFRARSRHTIVMIRSLIMHDVMHDLLLSLAGFKYKMADSNTDEFDERVRHVSVGKAVAESSWEVHPSLFKIKSLQSFIVAMVPACDIMVNNWSVCNKLINKFCTLRVLVLKGLMIKELPTSLDKLICLQYLDLSRTAIVKLPDSITKLVSLLSLHLRHCKNLQELPNNMNKLVNLRHLELKLCFKLSHMPLGLGKLLDLRTLDVFIVGKKTSLNASKGNVMGELTDLKDLNNIKGDLSIEVRRESKDIEPKARVVNLDKKDKLTFLSVKFLYSTKEDEMVLENLDPHGNLRVLFIKGYGGEILPRWMMDNKLHSRLSNLVSIRFNNLNHCVHLCFLGRLPCLKDLMLEGLRKVEYMENSYTVVEELNPTPLFPSLERLFVRGMPKFKGWWRMTPPSCGQEQHQLINIWKPAACPKLKCLTVDSVKLANTLGRSLLRNYTSLERLSIERKLPAPHEPILLLNMYFPKLVDLFFYHIDDLKVLPQEFRGFTSLENLYILNCKQLKELPEWIDNLASLKTIHIWKCSLLESLPRQIKLLNLNSILMFECSSVLEERYRRPTGEYWSDIEHIPRIYITSSNDYK